LLRLALIAMAFVVVAACPSSAELVHDDILPSSNFEKARHSTPPGAITVTGPAGAKYVLFDLNSHAVLPNHVLSLSESHGHHGWGPGSPSGIGAMLHLGHGWSNGDGDVGSGWKFTGNAGGSDGGGGGGSGSGAWSGGAGGGSGGTGTGGGQKHGNTSGSTSSALGSDYVTGDDGRWIGLAAAQVPEPATLGLLAVAFGMLTATARRRGGPR
jgi:PEP-CTERM motif